VADYKVEMTSGARRSVERLPRVLQARIILSAMRLASDPRPSGCRKLTDTSPVLYRIRIADYRVIYQVRDEVLLVLVVRVAHRKHAYDGP
jgi:mRNA interferase RelE/StbE